jgi:2-octaprenyl-6-methoxyphenol hydroxylase
MSTTASPAASAEVAIAGGGFVGLSLALALAKLAPPGLRVALIEDASAASAAAHDARASALSAASRNMLGVLGVWPSIEADAQPITAIEITDAPLGHDALRPSLLGFDNDLNGGEPAAYVVENAALLQALAESVAREPAVSVIAPDGVVDYRAGPFCVNVQLNTGAGIAAKLLVAADGRRSRLRERAGIKTVGWTYPQTGIVATVSHSRPHSGKAVQHFLPPGPFALLPLSRNRCSIVWTEEIGEAERIMGLDDPAFLAELKRRFGTDLGEIALAGPHQAFPLSLHIARDFVADRFALIGDAAHGVHPLAGQGLNIGLRDVAALSETLVEGLRLGLDPGDRVLLERYQRWRRFDSAQQALAMDILNRLFSNDQPWLTSLRDLGLELVGMAPPLKRFFVREAAGRTGAVPRLLQGKPL